ncbi:MAG: PAS domain S-box protein, partial [Vampirovibrionia bacterium]
LEALKKGGTTFDIELSVSSMMLNEEWHAVGIVRDITDRKKAEKEFENHHKQLESNHLRLQEKEEELISQNEELQAKEEELVSQNEELVSINEELDYSRLLLQNSLEQTLISEEKFRKLFASMYDGVIILEGLYDESNGLIDYKIIDLNSSAESLLSIAKQDLINNSLMEIFEFEQLPLNSGPDCDYDFADSCYYELYNNKFSKYYRIGLSLIEENRYVFVFNDITKRKNLEEELKTKKSGLEIAIQERTKDLKESNKNLELTQDELKKALESAEESAKKYRHLFKTMNEGLALCEIIYDSDDKPVNYILIDANPAFEKILGLNIDKTINKTATECLSVDYPPSLQEFYNVVKSGEPAVFISHLVSLNKYLHVSAFTPKENQFAALFTDITEHILMQNKLKESEQKFHAISDSALDPIIMIDSNGNTMYWNNSAQKVFGYTSEEVMGKSLHDLVVPAKYKNAISNGLVKFKETGKGPVIGSTIKVSAVTKEKKDITLEISISSIKLDGEWYAIAIARDITLKNKLETELRNNLREKFKLNKKLNEALKEADAANKSKSDFLAVISHEIRTPINGIVGIMNLLSDTDVTEEQQEYLKMLNLSTDTLLNIINNILDFSKLEVGKLTLQHNDFNLDENICDLLKCFSLIAQEKNINLVYSIDSNIPDIISGDASKLNQIIINLVNNAIKFTPEGEISIKIKQLYQTQADLCLLFSVSDTGIGIPEDKKSIIFDSFTQVDNSTTRKYGGTGLGLAIASELVELMNGEIWIESELDKGSTFNFTAVFNVANVSIDQIDFNNLPVLLFNDNQTSENFYIETLKKWNCNVTSICDISKIDEVMEHSVLNKTSYSIVIINAHNVEDEVKDLVGYMQNQYKIMPEKIVVITSSRFYHSIKNDRSGIKNILLRPIKQSELLEVIQNIILHRVTESKNRFGLFEIPESKSEKKLNILLAEDNEINKVLTEKILLKHGYNVVNVNNGKEALLAFENDEFDLVLLDLEMPELNGYEAAELILKDHNLPIIAFTAHRAENEREKVLNSGMVDFLCKPFTPEQLINCIEKYTIQYVVEPEESIFGEDTSFEYLKND